MNEKERRTCNKVFSDLHDYLYKNRIKEWAKQNDKPYCFVKFDPNQMTLSVCRWGTNRRPPGSDARLWFRIHAGGYQMENDVTKMLLELVKYWDEFIFDPFHSEPCPTIYPNMKTSIPLNIFQMSA